MIPLLFAVVVSLSEPARNAVLTVELEAAGRGPARVIEVLAGGRTLPVAVYPDGQARKYRLLLTEVSAGSLDVTAPGLRSAAVRAASARALRHAPFLSPRNGTIQARSDLPLLMYCEEVDGNGLQYTVIFSNEDGGTSTRNLMARWGRTSDIEYLYRVYFDGAGKVVRRTYQGKDHVDTEFTGPFDGEHALLTVTTRNNMVSPGTETPRFQLAPRMVDLTRRSRESVMDGAPWTHQAAAELIAENKLRPYGKRQGELVSDLRNYLFVDFGVRRTNGAAVAVHVRRKGDPVGYSSHLGRSDDAVNRDGQVRVAVELPPSTRLAQIESIGFECVLVPSKGAWPHSGECGLAGIARAFFLNRDHTPPPEDFRSGARATIRSGQTYYIRLP